jgi:hypothetical protein
MALFNDAGGDGSWRRSSGKPRTGPRRFRSRPSSGKLERWLTERRREIDRKYDYRYSVLPLVLAAFLPEGRLSEDDLRGLRPDKLNAICRMARS